MPLFSVFLPDQGPWSDEDRLNDQESQDGAHRSVPAPPQPHEQADQAVGSHAENDQGIYLVGTEIRRLATGDMQQDGAHGKKRRR